jgi:hypothetical protein
VTAGEWLVEALTWAAYETWWARIGARHASDYPCVADDLSTAGNLTPLANAVQLCPRLETWDAIRTEHRRRREALS